MLHTIGSNNGRLRGYSRWLCAVGQLLYGKAWLRDNRPYWLANNHRALRSAAQLWINRGEQWDSVIDGWDTTHTLPPAREVGLPSVQSGAQ